MSDSENTIPDEEIPIKKTRKKKEMTPEMLEQLRIAREKAIAVKKAMKDNPEKRVEHYKEKIKKIKEKPKTKKELMKQAEEELEKEEIFKRTNEEEKQLNKDIKNFLDVTPEPEPVKEEVEEIKVEEPKQDLDNNGFPQPPTVEKPVKEKTNNVKKKQVKYVYESGTSDEEDQIVYIKKRMEKPIRQNNNIPPAPFTSSPLMPPSLIGGASRFGSYGMYRR